MLRERSLTAPSEDPPKSARSETTSTRTDGYEKGQRLYCARCGSEIEILNPSTARPPHQEFLCCGEAMKPTTGVGVNVNVEG